MQGPHYSTKHLEWYKPCSSPACKTNMWTALQSHWSVYDCRHSLFIQPWDYSISLQFPYSTCYSYSISFIPQIAYHINDQLPSQVIISLIIYDSSGLGYTIRGPPIMTLKPPILNFFIHMIKSLEALSSMNNMCIHAHCMFMFKLIIIHWFVCLFVRSFLDSIYKHCSTLSSQ